MISLVLAKQDLCNVFNYLKWNVGDNSLTNCVKKSCNWHLTKMVFCVFLFINFLIGFALKNTNHYNLNIVTIFPLLICWFIQHGWFLFLAPVMAFHIYFLEISVMLLPWSWSLKEKLKESPLN